MKRLINLISTFRMKQALPGIIRIGYVECQLLPDDIMLRALSGTPIGIYTTITDVCFIGDATCDTEVSIDNNSQVEKATLTFRTLDELPIAKHLAFVIFTIQGDIYIIGTKELPYPTVKITSTTGTPDGEPSVRKYEVSLAIKKSLALCAV